MHYVSLIIEFLRGRPASVFWLAALLQAALWVIIPSLFYSTPPGGASMLLALGHEYRLGTHLGPPLAFWLGEIAYRAGGAFGLYLLAQACVVTAFWAVFTLGRAVVGTRHAVLAILLMAGIGAFTMPTPEFGPAVLAMPLWALALLHYWRAVAESRRGYWFLLALELGLLLLTSYVGAILLVLLIAFTPFTARGRAALRFAEPWISIPLLLFVVFPHAAWLKNESDLVLATLKAAAAEARVPAVLGLVAAIVVAHFGAAVLVVLASGWPRQPRERAPLIERNPVEPFARLFVYFFALMPAASALTITLLAGRIEPLERTGALLLLSGLAVVLAAGDHIQLYRERTVSTAWLALVVGPPVVVAAAIAVLPWLFAVDLRVAQPSGTMGSFFADSFQRRTGALLRYVAGDANLSTVVALGASSRPSVFFPQAPALTPWTGAANIRERGGVLVWPATDAVGTPPAAIRQLFPDIVPETPRVFPRAVQGRVPLTRLGWAVVRPQAAPARQ